MSDHHAAAPPPSVPPDDAADAFGVATSVWPVLHYRDTEAALRFLTAIGFHAAVVARDDTLGIVHCELRWPDGGTVLFGSAAHGDSVHSSMRPGTAAMYVPTRNVDAVHERVVAVGGNVVSDLADTTFGSGDTASAFTVSDTENYLWTFGTYPGRT